MKSTFFDIKRPFSPFKRGENCIFGGIEGVIQCTMHNAQCTIKRGKRRGKRGERREERGERRENSFGG